MAKTWNAFYDWVLPEVPAVPPALADQAIREATIDFYERSGLLIYQQPPITVVPGTGTYTLTAPTGYDPNRIDEMFMGTLRLLPVAQAQLAQMYIDWLTITGTPQFYLRETSDTFRLVPTPDSAMTFPDAITVRTVLIPTRAATQIAEDWIFENHVDDIATGAIARLMRMQQKPWTNFERAVMYDGLFRQGWSAARGQADRGKSGAVLSVRLKRVF